MTAIRLVILDVNGTLFSLDAVAGRLEEVGLGGELDLWFARILRDGFAAAAAGTFAAFPDLARHHLAVMLDEHGQPTTDEQLDRVIDGFTAVSAHDDVEPGLRRLRRAGATVVTMTNGTAEITRDFLHREQLDGLVDATYDVQEVGRWKPASDPYRWVLDQHDVAPSHAALTAVHPWDIHGARQTGLSAAWVNRAASRYPEAFEAPTVQARTFDDAIRKLLETGTDQ